MTAASFRAPAALDVGDEPQPAPEPARPLPSRSDPQPRPPIDEMRAAVAEILADEPQLPRFEELGRLAERLRGHVEKLIPEVEVAARALPDGGEAKATARDAVAAARARLGADAGAGLVSATRYARGLARELRDLCDQYEALSSANARGANARGANTQGAT